MVSRYLYRLWLSVWRRRQFHVLADKRLPEIPVRKAPPGRSNSIDEQYLLVKDQFGGCSELMFFLYCCVIRARRGIHPRRQAEVIRYCLMQHHDTLFAEMNTRWLVSFLNTIADYGSPNEARSAKALTTFLHMIKIYESLTLPMGRERSKLLQEAIDYQRSITQWADPAAFSKLELWDYMFIMSYENGDVIDNLFNRLSDERYPLINLSLSFILEKLRCSDLIFTKIMKANKFTRMQYFENEN